MSPAQVNTALLNRGSACSTTPYTTTARSQHQTGCTRAKRENAYFASHSSRARGLARGFVKAANRLLPVAGRRDRIPVSDMRGQPPDRGARFRPQLQKRSQRTPGASNSKNHERFVALAREAAARGDTIEAENL